MFKSDNSLSERLSRVIRERDASNWLTGELREEIKNIPFEKNAPALSDDENKKVSGVFGKHVDLLNNSVQESNKGIQWDSPDPNYPSQSDTKSQIRDYAARATLAARELQRARGTSGIGSKTLTRDQFDALMRNQDRNRQGFGGGNPEMIKQLVQAARVHNFDPKFIEATWHLVSSAFKESGKLGAGKELDKTMHAGMRGIAGNARKVDQGLGDMVAPNFDTKDYEGEDGLPTLKLRDRERLEVGPDGELKDTGKGRKRAEIEARDANFYEQLANGALGEEFRSEGGAWRARLMWKLFLQQGGRDALTGLPLDIDTMALEHVLGLKTGGTAGETKDQAKQRIQERDTDDNFVLIAKAVNDLKSDQDMDDFYENSVLPLRDVPEEDWNEVD